MIGVKGKMVLKLFIVQFFLRQCSTEGPGTIGTQITLKEMCLCCYHLGNYIITVFTPRTKCSWDIRVSSGHFYNKLKPEREREREREMDRRNENIRDKQEKD